MDTLTHALSGALLARATAPKDAPPRSLPRRLAAGFFACAAPDLDFVVGFVGPVEYLAHHRGVTHSLVLLPLWALGFSWLLAKILRERGQAVEVLHGDMTQGARLRALQAFTTGKARALIATNVAARGLDLEVSHVINFDIPEDLDTYVHRVGRTARAGRSGEAITFVGQHDLEAFDAIKRRLGGALQPHPLPLYR